MRHAVEALKDKRKEEKALLMTLLEREKTAISSLETAVMRREEKQDQLKQLDEALRALGSL